MCINLGDKVKQFTIRGFEENKGQEVKDIKYMLKSSHCTIYFLQDRIVFVNFLCRDTRDYHKIIKDNKLLKYKREYFELVFANSNSKVNIIGKDILKGKKNYIDNKYSEGKVTGINLYQSVLYQNLYKNIDLEFYFNKDNLECDFIVKKGGDVKEVNLIPSKSVFLEQDNLILGLNESKIRIRKPNSYEIDKNEQKSINSKWIVKENKISFKVDRYNLNNTLIIDPIIDFSTYIGGTQIDEGSSIIVDAEGSCYITGYTASNEYPKTTEVIGSEEDTEYSVFVSKFNNIGELQYSTVISGNSDSQGQSIAVDTNLNAYVLGITSSTNFPTTNILNDDANGELGVFLLKINSTGDSLIYSTFIHGDSVDYGYGVVLDSNNNSYITGYTTSGNFPITRRFGEGVNENPTAFIMKINDTGDRYLYSVVVNGDGVSIPFSINIDLENNAYIAGYNNSTEFPITTTIGTVGNGSYAMMIVKINAEGTEIVYSTAIGGADTDTATGIVIKSNGNAVIAGNSQSLDFPVTRVIGVEANNTSGIVVAELNSDGSSLLFSTLINGDDTDYANALAIDDEQNIYITGYTYSQNFPISDIFGIEPNNSIATYIVSLSETGTSLNYSSYINGITLDIGTSIALDGKNPYITGYTNSYDFPVINAYQNYLAGSINTFVLKLEDSPVNLTDLRIRKYVTPIRANLNNLTVIVIVIENISGTTAENVRVIDNLPTGYQYYDSYISEGTVTIEESTVSGYISEIPGGRTVILFIWVYPIELGVISNTATVSSSTAESNYSNNSSTINTEVVSVYDLLTNPEYGLEEIKSEVRNIENTTESIETGTESIENVIGSIENTVGNIESTNKNIENLINGDSTILNNIDATTNCINNEVVSTNAVLMNTNYGLEQLRKELDEIQDKLDNKVAKPEDIININININNISSQIEQLMNSINIGFREINERIYTIEQNIYRLNCRLDYFYRFIGNNINR